MAYFLATIESSPECNGEICQKLDQLFPSNLFLLEAAGGIYIIRSLVEIPPEELAALQSQLNTLNAKRIDSSFLVNTVIRSLST